MDVNIQLDEQLINANTCAAMFSVSVKTWRGWVKNGTAPKAKNISRTDVRWRLKDVKDLLVRFWEDPTVIYTGTAPDMSEVRKCKRPGRPRKYNV